MDQNEDGDSKGINSPTNTKFMIFHILLALLDRFSKSDSNINLA
jgi:hypothetical protein